MSSASELLAEVVELEPISAPPARSCNLRVRAVPPTREGGMRQIQQIMSIVAENLLRGGFFITVMEGDIRACFFSMLHNDAEAILFPLEVEPWSPCTFKSNIHSTATHSLTNEWTFTPFILQICTRLVRIERFVYTGPAPADLLCVIRSCHTEQRVHVEMKFQHCMSYHGFSIHK
jgi:hypothetical protein